MRLIPAPAFKKMSPLFLSFLLLICFVEASESTIIYPFFPEVKYGLYIIAPTKAHKRNEYFAMLSELEESFSFGMLAAMTQHLQGRRSECYAIYMPNVVGLTKVCSLLTENETFCRDLLMTQSRLSYPLLYRHLDFNAAAVPTGKFTQDAAIQSAALQTLEAINLTRSKSYLWPKGESKNFSSVRILLMRAEIEFDHKAHNGLSQFYKARTAIVRRTVKKFIREVPGFLQ